MKIILIGCGHIARTMHMPAIERLGAEHPDYAVCACVDTIPDAARAFAQDHSIGSWYAGLDEALHRERPDAAICLVRESDNHIVAGRLMELGIPTLMEKPPGRTTEECRYIMQRQGKTGAAHLVAFNRRYAPVYARVKEILGAEHIRYIDYHMYRRNRHEPTFETTAIHAVDAAAYLAGSPYSELALRYQSLPQHGEGVVNMLLTGEMHSGAAVTLRIMVSTGDVREGCEIHTDTRIISAGMTRPYGNGGCFLTVTQEGRQTVSLRPPQIDPSGQDFVANGFYHEHEAFYRYLLGGATPPSQLADVAQSVEICEAIFQKKPSYSPDE